MLLDREAELLFEPILGFGLEQEASAIKRLSLEKGACGEFQFRRFKSAVSPLSQRFRRRPARPDGQSDGGFASLLPYKSDNLK